MAGRPIDLQEALHHLAYRGIEPGRIGMPVIRERDRRDAAQRGFARTGHGAGIEHAGADVRAVVDAGDDGVGRPRQEALFEQRQVDAVRRGAVDRVQVLAVLHVAQRAVDGDRVAGRALLARRRHDHHAPERERARRAACAGRSRGRRRRSSAGAAVRRRSWPKNKPRRLDRGAAAKRLVGATGFEPATTRPPV